MASQTYILLLAAMVMTSGCTTLARSKQAPMLSVSELVRAPEKWDGKRIRVVGWLTRDFENFNLFASREAACGVGDRNAVGARSGSLIRYGTMRSGVFEGNFRNLYGTVQPDGEIIFSTGSRSPGPLEEISVIRWTTPAEPICRGD